MRSSAALIASFTPWSSLVRSSSRSSDPARKPRAKGPTSIRHRSESGGAAALGNALRTLRHERDLTQEELADLAGLSANYVGDTERGERNVSVRALWQLAGGLGVPASELLANAERRKREHKT